MNKFVLSLNAEQSSKLDELRVQIGAIDYREALSSALSFLAWAAREIAAGRVIGSTDKTGKFRKVEAKWMAAVPRKLFKAGET